MTPWANTDITADLHVQIIRDMPALPALLDTAVEQAWQGALTANPSLFNGRIFSADQLTPSRIDGHWTEYRRAVAQMNQPELVDGLHLRPLAVCGVLICWQNGQRAVLFGKRSARTSYQQGLWQLPPAGSVDFKAAGPNGRVDVRQALFTELREELGLSANCARAVVPLCAVEHPGSGVLDLGFAIITDLKADAVLETHALCGDLEYSEMHAITIDEALEFVLRIDVVPSARVFLEKVLVLI